MSQATELTAEELATLAGIAGLRLCCYSDGREYWGLDLYPICAPGDWHPDQNWGHLGIVIKGMADKGFGLDLHTWPAETERRLGSWAWFRLRHDFGKPDWRKEAFVAGDGIPAPLAICRAALAATEGVGR